jgi:hypothetical protein
MSTRAYIATIALCIRKEVRELIPGVDCKAYPSDGHHELVSTKKGSRTWLIEKNAEGDFVLSGYRSAGPPCPPFAAHELTDPGSIYALQAWLKPLAWCAVALLAGGSPGQGG